MTKRKAEMVKLVDIGEVCVYCHESVKFGSGRFVNRIPASTETEIGYMCPDCVAEFDAEFGEESEEDEEGEVKA